MKALFLATFLPLAALAAPSTSMEITSADFPAGGTIPSRFTCEGTNESPGLRIQYAPEKTQSLALIVDDPDAPKGTFTHWLVWDIKPETKEFATGNTPAGVVQGTNDKGVAGYFGPCPPSGQHRYYFHLYALDTIVKLPAGSKRTALEKAIKGHILAEATLLGRFGRSTSSPTP